MHKIQQYQEAFRDYLSSIEIAETPASLYAPVKYILDLGGKRLRPVLTLMATDIFGGDYKKAMGAAMSIEVFHNFSLIHDDIMDDAPLRRGKATVHEKWDVNTGILAGDAMLIMAYQMLEDHEPATFRNLVRLFSHTAMKVCEGQQYDIDFETSDDVSYVEYLQMIEYKTAVLIGTAMKMGAIVANASESNQNLIFEFGKSLGIAFQLQDDYLDAFGDETSFGKQIGGDIIENKKTVLYIKALELSSNENKLELQHLYSINPNDVADKVATVKQIFTSSGAVLATQNDIRKFTEKAFSILDQIPVAPEKKATLKEFGHQLMNRNL